MKLRNKKTGKVQTLDFAVISDDSARDGELASLNSHIFIFRSIKQLNEDYEDYAPKEPLTKSEKQIIKEALMALLGQGKLVGFDLSGECQRIIDKLDKEGEE